MLEMNASSKMLPAFIFYPIVMEIHRQSPRQLRFQGEFGPIVTLLGYHICPNPPFLVLGRGGEKLLENHKKLTHKTWSLRKRLEGDEGEGDMTLFLWKPH